MPSYKIKFQSATVTVSGVVEAESVEQVKAALSAVSIVEKKPRKGKSE